MEEVKHDQTENQPSKKMSLKEMKSELSAFLVFLVGAAVMLYDPLISVVVFVFLMILFMIYTKSVTRNHIIISAIIFVIAIYTFLFFLTPSVAIARGSGPIMNDNWWQSLNWIRENTGQDAVIATYWDFGHFITAVARRPVVFDGASQSDLYSRPAESGDNNLGVIVENYDHSIERIKLYNDGNVTTARIKDIASVLLTDNESFAVDILKDYRVNGTGPVYFIASADLLGKSFWWTYFSTWSPSKTKGCPGNFNHGECYSYSIVQLTSTRPLTQEGAVSYNYVSGNQGFVVVDRSGQLEAFLLQSGQLVPIGKIFYINSDGTGTLRTQPSAPVKGLLWVDVQRQTVIYMPPELENSLFTRMFLFNGQSLDGQPLKYFEAVGNWGGEIKLYKVEFPE